MGQMRFHAPTPEKLLPHAAELAYLAGLEAIPWRGRNRLVNGILTIERSISESGNLYIPWHIPGLGQRVLSTCTLMEREQSYDLSTELARGTLHRARTLVAELESAGASVPDELRQRLQVATSALFRATTAAATAEEDAQQTIQIASAVIAALMRIQIAVQLDPPAATRGASSAILACQLSDSLPDAAEAAVPSAFHAVNLPFRWRDLQPTHEAYHWQSVERQLAWCRQNGLRVLAGPLIQLDALSLPDRAYDWHDDYDRFEDAALDYVQDVVRRFDGVVDIWVCAGRLNVPEALDLNEEQKLRLAVATIEAVRHASPRTPVVISFDQPWAEYLAAEDLDLSPLHFADALVRAELGVAGVALEINLGYWPNGTLPRDLLAISRHLDRWSLLGIPLLVYLTMPSQLSPDPHAIGPSQIVPACPSDPHTASISQDIAEQLIPLLLSKPALHGIIWNQLSDASPHEFPHSGLFTATGQAKPILGQLAAIRRKYLA